MSDGSRYSGREDAAREALDRRIERVLSAAPELRIPEDFAARVAARLPPAQATQARPTHYARTAMLLCGAALLIAMFYLVPQAARGTRVEGLLELLFSVELVMLALAVVSWRHGLGWVE